MFRESNNGGRSASAGRFGKRRRFARVAGFGWLEGGGCLSESVDDIECAVRRRKSTRVVLMVEENERALMSRDGTTGMVMAYWNKIRYLGDKIR